MDPPCSPSCGSPEAGGSPPGAPPRIGLTGGIGSGKSTVAAVLGGLGAVVIDSDAIARALTVAGGEAIPALRAEFGPDAIDVAGALDRERMRRRVFADPAARRRLEALLHPLIRERGERLAREAAARAPYLVFDVPLLVEGGRGGDYDRVLVVDAPPALQLERACARGGLAAAQVRAIMAGQAGRAQRLAAADDVLVNAGTVEELRERAQRLHRAYCAAAGASRR